MAKYVTRTEDVKRVTFKVYNRTAQALEEITVDISDCEDGNEIIQCCKENATGVTNMPVDVVSVKRVKIKYKMETSYFRNHAYKSYVNPDDEPSEDEETTKEEDCEDEEATK